MKQLDIKNESINNKIEELLLKMTIDEKIGQLYLVNSEGKNYSKSFKDSLIRGKFGALLNEVDITTVNELQRIVVNESRLGIPLLIGRDVIHGFKTIFPIPLGQAASWNLKLVEECARISSIEASEAGINWVYSPMLDVGRDPRWGRVAESFGEDPFLISILGQAMIQGIQGDDLSLPTNIAACAKHFVGYGASESGKDYNTTNIPENELRNVHLPPFKRALETGVASLMTSFSDLNGVPSSANYFILKQILRNEWKYDGFVVSDWESIGQLKIHGFTANDKESAFEAANAGVDMEMTSSTYSRYLKTLIEENKLTVEQLDQMVSNVLRVKFKLGLFEQSFLDSESNISIDKSTHLQKANEAALESIVLLKNKNNILPISKQKTKSVALIGMLADNKHEQLGTWVFDGDSTYSVTIHDALQNYCSEEISIQHEKALDTTRSKNISNLPKVLKAVNDSDTVILVLGEEAILSGEAHCRADISLPGFQEELLSKIAETDKPIILVVMAGRPLLLENIIDKVDAILYAWHPGNMAGPAIVDLIFGNKVPSGKLPISFPRVTGQIPIYYAHKNTGRPATPESIVDIDNIELGALQHSVGNTSFHLDTNDTPLFPFGFGLSYTEFKYANLKLNSNRIKIGESIQVTVELTNVGNYDAEEVVQLYVRDLVGNVTRPVKELKGFQKVKLASKESKQIKFEIHSDELSFYNRKMKLVTEPGDFHLWVGGSSLTELKTEFSII